MKVQPTLRGHCDHYDQGGHGGGGGHSKAIFADEKNTMFSVVVIVVTASEQCRPHSRDPATVDILDLLPLRGRTFREARSARNGAEKCLSAR